MTFTSAERTYLRSVRLGRLATIDPHGAPQNNPVGFAVNDDGTVDIGGRDLAATRKFRNVTRNPAVALVVDDVASVDPWVVRGVEIRGWAETVSVARGPDAFLSPDVIRIHPRRIISWGVDADAPGMTSRDVGPVAGEAQSWAGMDSITPVRSFL